ncbi:MAG: helix-turn-helix domain-containing protein [Suipraeoptans sp.]
MQYFKSIDEIFRMNETGKWTKEITPRGIKMSPTAEYGEGSLEYMGDPRYFFWTAADHVYYKNYVCGTSIDERYIEIGENSGFERQTIEHYQTKDNVYPVEPGLNCYVNFTRWNYFSRAPVGLRLVYTSLLIRESFFSHYGITLPDDFWERAPQVLNPEVLYIPEVSSVMRQVSGKFNMQTETLPCYLKAKAMETAALLIDFVYSRKGISLPAVSAETKEKITAAQKIINENLVQPPMVNHLGELVGLNKNALQRGFRVCTGHSVGEYLRARRMDFALELLRNTEMNVAEIAKKSGYQSPANFYTAFEKTFAARPSEMRILLRSK